MQKLEIDLSYENKNSKEKEDVVSDVVPDEEPEVVPEAELAVVVRSGIIDGESYTKRHLRDGQVVPLQKGKSIFFCWFIEMDVALHIEGYGLVHTNGVTKPEDLSNSAHEHRRRNLGGVAGKYEVRASKYPGFGLASPKTFSIDGGAEFRYEYLSAGAMADSLVECDPNYPARAVFPQFLREVPKKESKFIAWDTVHQEIVYLNTLPFPNGPTMYSWETISRVAEVAMPDFRTAYQKKVEKMLKKCGRVFFGYPLTERPSFTVETNLIPDAELEFIGQDEYQTRCTTWPLNDKNPLSSLNPFETQRLIDFTRDPKETKAAPVFVSERTGDPLRDRLYGH